MRRVFADTHFWIAFLDQRDPWHERATRVSRRLGKHRIITTDAVLAETLSFLCDFGSTTRSRAAAFARDALARPDVEVVPESRDLFLSGLALYESRLDKSYSLVDCVSMQVMREKRLRDVLTHDKHFEQEGFTILLGE